MQFCRNLYSNSLRSTNKSLNGRQVKVPEIAASAAQTENAYETDTRPPNSLKSSSDSDLSTPWWWGEERGAWMIKTALKKNAILPEFIFKFRTKSDFGKTLFLSRSAI